MLSSIVMFCKNMMNMSEFTDQTLHSLYELISYLNTETQFFISQLQELLRKKGEEIASEQI